MTLTRAQGAVVVDASTAIPFLQDEAEIVGHWQTWVDRADLLIVPAHFAHEVANGLLRGSSLESVADVLERMRALFAVGLEVADRGLVGLEESIRLADRHRLTVYDAAYLELAIDLNGELATRDAALAAAAAAEGVGLAA